MKKFDHYISMPIQEVMADPDMFIIPENRRAIEFLWDMNILTTQTNDYDNEYSWISIGQLSSENADIYWDYFNADRKKLIDCCAQPGTHLGYGYGFSVPVVPGTKDTFEDFLPLLSLLKFQDVQDDGYLTVDEFYFRYTDCFDVVDNPDYGAEPEFEFPLTSTGIRKTLEKFYREHKYSDYEHIRVFNPEKATKSLEEYLADFGLLDFYDPDEGKIFLNKRLYDGHMKYKKLYGSKDKKIKK